MHYPKSLSGLSTPRARTATTVVRRSAMRPLREAATMRQHARMCAILSGGAGGSVLALLQNGNEPPEHKKCFLSIGKARDAMFTPLGKVP